MLFDDNDFNYEISLFKIPGNDLGSNNGVFLDAMDGFLRGNLESGTYMPYKDYTYFNLKANNEQEKLLLRIMAISFAINDLNLYLDLNPSDLDTYQMFKEYALELNELEMMYAKKYGPLCVTETQGANFDWIKNPWPWDGKGGSMYV